MHVFTRYIATYIVVPAGLIGAFALGTSANADAAPVHQDWHPSIVATPTVKAPTAAGPGTSHNTRRQLLHY
ncbi:hypothetical protein ACIA48_00925 [Mycobacterium sp. NPDC051804]|uniref:hypothetical protein n=1 Tax=Mycobacterium sp. NPDC051804 TaxID=3364295 RepID=UPI003796472C